ncbi:hypothetical protein EON63_02200 [archaeon]|nr:MAG: hypothetical protein EON63_02200 [archaeon]
MLLAKLRLVYSSTIPIVTAACAVPNFFMALYTHISPICTHTDTYTYTHTYTHIHTCTCIEIIHTQYYRIPQSSHLPLHRSSAVSHLYPTQLPTQPHHLSRIHTPHPNPFL